jgi:chemotaxis protein MotA
MAADAEVQSPAADINIRITPPVRKPDISTILGLSIAIGLIIAAIAMGNTDANFLNGPSFLIVILGTMAATSVSYTGDELKYVPSIIGNTMLRKIRKPSTTAKQLMDISSLARKKGLLALSSIEAELKKDPFLARAVQLVTDGYTPEEVERILGQEIDSISERHRRSAGVVRRASEVAPAMGLIGTLVGLVQMLAQLEDPSSIGPAMAVALLTTFYGAILGTIVLGPLSGKLERNSNHEMLTKNLIMMAMGSIARQENPRRLEMVMNSELPPEEQIKYFN